MGRHWNRGSKVNYLTIFVCCCLFVGISIYLATYILVVDHSSSVSTSSSHVLVTEIGNNRHVGPVQSSTLPLKSSNSTDSGARVQKNDNTNITPKIILSWTYFFDKPLGTHYFWDCPELQHRCALQTNRSFLPLADAVVFHRDNLDWADLPASRQSKQRFVFFTHEPPAYTHQNLNAIPNYFNWTMTMRLDSDAPYPYTRVEHVPALTVPSAQEIVKGKSKPIAWMVSNCKTHSGREHFVAKLIRHIPVDIYGKCGKLQCAYSSYDECNRMIERDYWFYLSLENSVCRDTITEKFWAIAQLNVVPVVLKREIYSKGAVPPNSFIAVDDFASMDQLVAHLKYLMRNATAYLDHLRWKWQGYALRHSTPNARIGFCKLCENLHNESLPVKWYSDLNKWFVTESACRHHFGAQLFV